MTQIKYCDRLASIIVRAMVGKCQLHGKDNIKCSGNLQHMHIITRRAWHIRHALFINAVCGCEAHHMNYTYPKKELWMPNVARWWPEKYADLMTAMQNDTPGEIDYHGIAHTFELIIKDMGQQSLIGLYPFSKHDVKLITPILLQNNTLVPLGFSNDLYEALNHPR